MVSRGFTSREFAGRSSFGIKLANPSDTMLAWSVHRLFLFKAFQLFLVTYPHTVVLETLIDNVKFNFFLRFCFVELLRIYEQLFRWYFSYSLWKNGHPLLSLLLWSLLLTTCSVVVQTSPTIWPFFFLTGWPEDHKNRCLSSSTNNVGLHFHEGVEKIKENDKNTKIENLQNGQEKYGGENPRVRVHLGQKLKKIIISSNFSLKLLWTVI